MKTLTIVRAGSNGLQKSTLKIGRNVNAWALARVMGCAVHKIVGGSL